MRGKLRDKRADKRDNIKREMLGRRPARRDNRHLPLTQQTDDENDDVILEEEDALVIEEEQQN